MGNNVKKRFTVSLDIETKDLEKQVKSTVGNLKTILADLGNASDKMGYFKELVDYISQIDDALTALKTKNGNLFNTMFDGLDADLKKVMESIFETSSKSMSVLDELRNKVNDASKNGSGVKELRQMAVEINALFAGLGKAEPIDIDAQFSGRGKTEDRIKILTDALDNFAVVWDNVNNKVKGGFGFEGTGGVVEFSEEVQKEIDKLEDKIKSIQGLMKSLKDAFNIIKDVQNFKDITGDFDTSEQHVQELINQFKLLSDAKDQFAKSGDTSSSGYYLNMAEYTKVATELYAIYEKLASDNMASKDLRSIIGGTDDKAGIQEFLNSINKKFTSDLKVGLGQIITDTQSSIDKIKADALKDMPKQTGQVAGKSGSGSSDAQTAKNKELTNSYDELSKKINEYYNILQQRRNFNESSDEYKNLSSNLDAISDSIQRLKSLDIDQEQDLQEIFGDLEYEEYGPEEALKRVCELLQVEMPKAKTQLQEFFALTDKITHTDFDGNDDNVEIGKYTERLEAAKRELYELGRQGLITADELSSIDNAFEKASRHLELFTSHYTGYSHDGDDDYGAGSGSGSGKPITNIDFTSLENTIKAEISSLANKLDNVLKVEVVKNDTADIQNAIDGVKSTIDKISVNIDNYNALKNASENQAEVDAMKNNLTQLYKYISDFNARKINGEYQHQEIGAAILSDRSISTAFGEKGTVPWDRMASSLVSNLTKSLLVDIHSHPWASFRNGKKYANDPFSGSSGDLGAFRFSKELGAQMAAMITGDIMRTLDLSKLTDVQMKSFRAALADIEKTYANTPEYSKYMEYDNGKMYYRSQNTLKDQHEVTAKFESLMYKAFERIGFSKDKVDQEIFKKYNLTDDKQLTELAERLVVLSHSAQTALSPIDRLAEIISAFGGDIQSEKAKVGFDAYNKGELTAAEVFNGLNGRGYKINQDTLDSLYRIDTSNEISAVESLLTQISGVLDVISSGISNIDANTRKDTVDKYDSYMNDLIDIRDEKIGAHITSSIKSIFDPLNISEFKSKEVLSLAQGSTENYQSALDDTYRNAYFDSLDISEVDAIWNKFATAISHVQDALKQIYLYEDRTKTTVMDGTSSARDILSNKYSDLVDWDNLQKLMYILSQAKINIGKTKDFYKDGVSSAYSPDDIDYSGISGHLQSIQSILDSIYGILHGFTGIEAENKNFLKYKEPVVDTNPIEREYKEQDLSVLNSILQAIQKIGNYLYANKSNDVTDNADKENSDITNLVNIIQSKFSQQLALEDTLQAVKTVVDNLYTVVSQENNETKPEDQNTEEPKESDVYQLLASKLPQNVASEDTLSAIRGILEQIAETTKTQKDEDEKDADIQESLGTLVSALTATVQTLKDATNGIVQYQKAQKSNTSAAQARIADPKQHQQISDIALNSVGNLGNEFEIKSLKALSDGLVKVEGAFKNANGEWEGFTVKVNNANAAVDLAIDKQSAFAKALNKAQEELSKASDDDNIVKFTPEETYKKALEYMKKLNAEGKKATLQYQDNGRYTVSTDETVGGLSKTTFQTFDEFQKVMSRTTVTLSNDIAASIRDVNKIITDKATKVGNAELLEKYRNAYADLIQMNQKYEAMDNLGQDDINAWNQQIALVKQLGAEVSGLIKKQEKLDTQKGLAISKEKLTKYRGSANQLLKDTGIDLNTSDVEQKKVVDAYDAIIEKIASLKNSHAVLTDEQINEINALISALKDEAKAYMDLHGIVKETKKVKVTRKQSPKKTSEEKVNQKLIEEDVKSYRKEIEQASGNLDFKFSDTNLTDEQNAIVNLRKQAMKYIEDAINGGQVELGIIKQTIEELKAKSKAYKEAHNLQSADQIKDASIDATSTLKDKFKTLDFKVDTNNLSDEQKKIEDEYDELIKILQKYSKNAASVSQEELNNTLQRVAALQQEIQAYKDKYNITNGRGGTKNAYGKTATVNAQAKFNTLKSRSQSYIDDGSIVVSDALTKYETSLNNLIALQKTFKSGQELSPEQLTQFTQLKNECNEYGKALKKVLDSSDKLQANGMNPMSIKDDIATDTYDDRAKALQNYVQETYGASAAIGKLNGDATELAFAIKNGDGTITNMTASLNAARTAIASTTGETQKASSAFDKFFTGIKGKFASITSYLISMTGIQEAWQAVRQGVTYVREIDSALTELKKVTDETDATYNRFLQNMSKTAGIVGSTVSELTTMASEWARLGYSIEDSAKLAESTAILLNVSEFQDATAASEALISTMQAFQYTADESQHVVDILNEVGNNYAVSSDGIATALQDSASALMEGGNNLEQATALVAAANRVVRFCATSL